MGTIGEKPNKDQWYFAYGSNLAIDQKVGRTGAIRRAIPCVLTGYRFVFNKRSGRCGFAANIVPDLSEELWGVIYLCSEEAMTRMDGWEGGYDRQTVHVTTRKGERVEAIAYVAPADAPQGRPAPDYLEKIVRGAGDHHLPEEYTHRIQRIAKGEAYED